MPNPSSVSGNKTVRFNVGGKTYEVAQSLLEQHPDTMLARIASNTWRPGGDDDNNDDDDTNLEVQKGKKRKVDNGSNESEEKKSDDADADPADGESEAFFIERDGERFRYCLDYMRDGGTVNLPPTIPKDALLQDLTYYGFQDIDPSKISFIGSIPILKTCFENIDAHMMDFEDEIVENEIKQSCLKLAKCCLDYYRKNASLAIRVQSEGISPENHEELRDANDFVLCNETHQRQFDEYLKRLGLKYDKKKSSYEKLVLAYL